MKTYTTNIYCSLFALLTLGLFSCKKSFLEIDPKGKLVAKATNDYNLLFNNTGILTSGNAYGALFLGDEVISVSPYFTNMAELRAKKYFQYEADNYEANEDGIEFTELMKPLYVYNKVANEVMEATGGSNQERLNYKAEALMNRAWTYFMLINYYGKPYNEVSSSTDPGFPIITVADVNQTNFDRASVKAVYDFMISDLKTAIPDLPISAGNRTRGCRAAAEALLGKVYLFMGRYQEALVQLNNAFRDLPTAYVLGLYDYNTTLAVGGAWGYNPATSPITFISGTPLIVDNQEVLFARQFTNLYSTYLNDILLSPTAILLYGSKDQRLKFFSRFAYGGVALKTPDVYRKIGPIATLYGITMPDLYLMRAELKARTGDVSGAKTDLETFRSKRIGGTDNAVNVTDATAMIKFVIEERTREFALQGYRWFDMRRLSVDPIFAGTTYAHQALSETGAVIATFPLTADRFTLRFPRKIINSNPGMTNNP